MARKAAKAFATARGWATTNTREAGGLAGYSEARAGCRLHVRIAGSLYLLGSLARCNKQPAGVYRCTALLPDGRTVYIRQVPLGRPL